MGNLKCPKCKRPLSADARDSVVPATCARCRISYDVHLFPALWNQAAAAESGQRRLSDEECPCFYHPGKRAAKACDNCGRFICELCDVGVGGRGLCPHCVDRDITAGGQAGGGDLIRYDHIALALAVLPIPIWYITPLTAPVALYFSIRYWNARSAVRRMRQWLFVLSGLLAALQIGGWLLVLYVMLRKL